MATQAFKFVIIRANVTAARLHQLRSLHTFPLPAFEALLELIGQLEYKHTHGRKVPALLLAGTAVINFFGLQDLTILVRARHLTYRPAFKCGASGPFH